MDDDTDIFFGPLLNGANQVRAVMKIAIVLQWGRIIPHLAATIDNFGEIGCPLLSGNDYSKRPSTGSEGAVVSLAGLAGSLRIAGRAMRAPWSLVT
jgi:hypothetical protein